MKHVVSVPTEPFRPAQRRAHPLAGGFEVHQIPAWEDNLVWLFVCEQTGATAVIDGPDAAATLPYLEKRGLKLTHILNTHTHADHIGINRDLARRGLLDGLTVIGPEKTAQDVPGITQAVSEGDKIQVGAFQARVMLTEGHIEGHICFVFDGVLFCGDTLFTGGCGRVFTQDYAAMQDSLSRLRALDPELYVCCAHEYTEDNLRFARSVEPDNQALEQRARAVAALRADGRSAVPSKLREELETNPFLRWDVSALKENVRAQVPDVNLDDPVAVVRATRQLKDSGQYRKR
jgi:hydroxyacylglutathione hydrolase